MTATYLRSLGYQLSQRTTVPNFPWMDFSRQCIPSKFICTKQKTPPRLDVQVAIYIIEVTGCCEEVIRIDECTYCTNGELVLFLLSEVRQATLEQTEVLLSRTVQ